MIWPATAAGATVTGVVHTVPPLPAAVSPGVPVEATVSFPIDSGPYKSACFAYTFEGDLLGPGDELALTFGSGASGPGLIAPNGEDAARTSCIARDAQPELVDLLSDGAEDFTVSAVSGTFTLAGLAVSAETLTRADCRRPAEVGFRNRGECMRRLVSPHH
jgi:hypothetical protein